jgi:hypothetical protein
VASPESPQSLDHGWKGGRKVGRTSNNQGQTAVIVIANSRTDREQFCVRGLNETADCPRTSQLAPTFCLRPNPNHGQTAAVGCVPIQARVMCEESLWAFRGYQNLANDRGRACNMSK